MVGEGWISTSMDKHHCEDLDFRGQVAMVGWAEVGWAGGREGGMDGVPYLLE